jgi:hypothetical protein
MAACDRVELRNKNDKFITTDLDTNNLYIEPKTIGKTARQQIIKGSEWESRYFTNNSLLLYLSTMTHLV